MGHESHSSFKDRDRLDRGTPDSPKHFYVAARYRSQAPVRVPFRGPPPSGCARVRLGVRGLLGLCRGPGVWSWLRACPCWAVVCFGGFCGVVGVRGFCGSRCRGCTLAGSAAVPRLQSLFFRGASTSKNFSGYGSTDPRSRDDIPRSNDPRIVLAACHTSGELELRGPGKSARGSFESDCRLAISTVYCLTREAG